MTGTLTYSGVTGPAISLTAQVFSNVHKLTIDVDKEVILVEHDNPSKLSTLDLRASTTMTATLVAGQSISISVS